VALQKDIIDDLHGMAVSGAYLKFSFLRWSSADNKVMATVSVFATSTSEADEKRAISSIELDITDMFPGIQAQVYARIKADPRLSDAIDI